MYEAFYGLTATPFLLTPDPRLFFESESHKRALAYLRYGIAQGEGFIIITGDAGTGKSMLVSTLFRSLENENVVAAQIVTTQLDSNDLLRMVAAAFGLAFERESKANLLGNLVAFFRSCMQAGKRVLVVVDEAQGLPRPSIEELRMLSNLHTKGQPLMQSFLLGQKEFRTTMRSQGLEQLQQRVIAAYHLQPFGEDETRAYIEHRLKLCGWHDDPRFTKDVFLGIQEFTQGVPRRINTLCNRLLLYGCLRELHEIDREAFTCVTQDIVKEQGGIPVTGADCLRGSDSGKVDSGAEPRIEEPSRVATPQSRSPDVRINTPLSTDDHAHSLRQRRTRTEPDALVDDSPRISPDGRAPAPEHVDDGDGMTSPSSSLETTMERTESLNKILKNLQSGSPDVEASALITEDGLMIASSLPQDLDEVTVGGMSATLLHLGTRAATALHRGDVKEVIVRGEGGYGVMVSAGRGVLLLVVANENAKLGLIFFDMRAAISAIKQVL
jgi:putative secretion ATPase (PEP-CTERM system associated)